MAKEYLVRYGTLQEFETIRLAVRELGFVVDVDQLMVGTSVGNKHIPNEDYVSNMILDSIHNAKIPSGTTTEVSSDEFREKIFFNTSINKLQYRDADDLNHTIVTFFDMLKQKPVTKNVEAEDIDTANNNTVTITGYDRPIVMVFLNGILCTENENDPHMITVDSTNGTLSIANCEVGDIISYF